MHQVFGPEFLPAFCAATADLKLRHFFYRGADGVAVKATAMLQKKISGLEIAGVYSPPFRPLNVEEKVQIIQTINDSRPDVLAGC